MPPETNFPVDTTWVFKQFIFEDVLRELDDHFQRLSIDYMPIKGAYLICSGLAKQIKSRGMSDIDILVRERDFDEVVSYFRSIPNVTIAEGSWPVNKKGWPFEVTFYYPFKGSMVSIDFHKLINLRERFLLEPEVLFNRGVKQGRRTLPSAEDALAICLCHGFSHAAHALDDNVFNDIAILINTSINWPKFWRITESTGITAFIYYVLKKIEKKDGVQMNRLPKSTIKFIYVDFLLERFFGKSIFPDLPKLFRRFFIELPLCRNPIGLIVGKCSRRCRY